MTEAAEPLRETLRRRLLRGLQAGSLRPGDRLPSARELSGELGLDHRAIVAAYRELETEGLVELRPRSGVYVPAAEPGGALPMPSATWLTEVHLQGMARGIPLPELSDWIYRSSATLRLRAVVIATTPDQAAGLCRELRDDFGLEASGVSAEEVDSPVAERQLARADLLVSTAAHAPWVRQRAEQLGKPAFIVTIRPDLLDGEWRLLLKRPLYVVVRDERFGDMLRQFLDGKPGAENLRIVMAEAGAVRMIPDGAPTYVTRGASELLAGIRIPGRILPSARVLSDASARELVGFIITANLDALQRGSRRRDAGSG